MKARFIFICVLFILFSPTVLFAKRTFKAEHVVLIGLDAWGSYSMEKAKMPHVRILMENGMYTLDKRTVLPSSSAVNWGSMFMGAGPEIHGYTEWGSRTPELPSRVIYKNNIFPTIFQLLNDTYPEAEIGCLYEWKGIKYLVDTLSLDYHAQAVNSNIKPDELCEMAEKYIIEKQPTLLAVCFDNPDHVGHKEGHDTPAYYAKLEELDGYIGRILDAIEKAGMKDDTIVILTSDHGGINKGHGGKTLEEIRTPFIISGKNVWNKGEFLESMVQYDVAATIAYIFQLEQPQVWTGRAMKQVFKK